MTELLNLILGFLAGLWFAALWTREPDRRTRRDILTSGLVAARFLLNRCTCQAPGGEDADDHNAWQVLLAAERAMRRME